jgi:uncharacterized protein involved in exopolysaccharide biosynthesis
MDTEDQIKQSEIDLIDYIKIIYKRWWIILIIVFASMFHTAISSLRQPKMYEAYATFFPLSLNQNAEESEVFFFKPQIDIRTMVISLLDSRKMTDRVIEELDLRTLWNISSMTETRKMLKSSISITLEKIGIIRLAAQSDSPELAAKIANAYVDNLDYFNQQLDIGPQKRIVQMVDRAVAPDEKIPRGTIRKVTKAGTVAFLFAIFLVFLIDFIKRAEIIKRLKEK